MQIGSIFSHVQNVGRLGANRNSVEAGGGKTSIDDVVASGASSGSVAGTQEAPKSAAQKAEEKAAAAKAERDSLRKELDDYLSKSPAEHMRDAILKEMGLTEDDLAAMPAEKREALESEIAQRMRERLLAKKEEENPASQEQMGQIRAARAVSQYQAQVQEGGVSPAGMPDFELLRATINQHTST